MAEGARAWSSAARGVALAVGLLTRLPVPFVAPGPRNLRVALAFFPAVGLLVGSAAALTVGSWERLAGSVPLVSGLLAVTMMALVSGALHLDGLADLVDGLSGGRGDRVRTLAILRDSRIGAHGAVALVLVIFLQVAACDALAARGAFAAIALGPVAARAVLVLVVVALPYARDAGLGASLCRAARPWCGVLALSATTAACVGRGHAIALGTALLGGALVGLVAWRRLGGATGDVYGAVVEVAQAAFVLAALAETR